MCFYISFLIYSLYVQGKEKAIKSFNNITSLYIFTIHNINKSSILLFSYCEDAIKFSFSFYVHRLFMYPKFSNSVKTSSNLRNKRYFCYLFIYACN